MDVAIYLRKSREDGDGSDTLGKHRYTLTELAKSKGYNYTLYEEVQSGEKIAYRPKMQELLEDVENGKYEAVLVMDVDRLGRGSSKDWGIIFEAFYNEEHNTLIITPQKTYDLSNETDELTVDMYSLFAKLEYKQIKKRMLRGKITGAQKGQWVCGKPPYPYEKINKTLVVNEDKAKIYRLIVDKALENHSLEEIQKFLNLSKIQTPSGKIPEGNYIGWDARYIKKLLVDETHLGYIVYGKTKGDTRKGNWKRKPKSEWIKTKGEHQALKTQEEHDTIISLINSRTTIPVAARAGKWVLSGLVFCGKCGGSMRITITKGKYKTIQCDKKYKTGNRCPQRGSSVSGEFLPNIYNFIFNADDTEKIKSLKEDNSYNKEIHQLIKSKEKDLAKAEQREDRLYDLYLDGNISKMDFTKRKKLLTEQTEAIKKSIEELNSKIRPVMSEKEFIKKILSAEKKWKQSMDDTERNKLLKSIVKKIIYNRDGDNPPTMEVIYH